MHNAWRAVIVMHNGLLKSYSYTTAPPLFLHALKRSGILHGDEARTATSVQATFVELINQRGQNRIHVSMHKSSETLENL